MQILGTFLGIGMAFTKLVASLYRTVAKVYQNMIGLTDGLTNSALATTLENAIDNVYVLLGVFMLFRIAISLLNYLVDPDKVSDKNVGGGKLITHIIISIILLMSANKFIFPQLSKLQDALLDTEGILYKILPTTKDLSNSNNYDLISKSEQEQKIAKFESTNLFITTVNATGNQEEEVVNTSCDCEEYNIDVQYDGEEAKWYCYHNCSRENVEKSFIEKAKADFNSFNSDPNIKLVQCSGTITKNCYNIYASEAYDVAPNDALVNHVAEVKQLDYDPILPGETGDTRTYKLNYSYYKTGTNTKDGKVTTCLYAFKNSYEETVYENNVSTTVTKEKITDYAYINIKITSIDEGLTIKDSNYNNATNKVRIEVSSGNITTGGITFHPINFNGKTIRYGGTYDSGTEEPIVKESACPSYITGITCDGNECIATGTARLYLKETSTNANGDLICGRNSNSVDAFKTCTGQFADDGTVTPIDDTTSKGAYESLDADSVNFAMQILGPFVEPSSELTNDFLTNSKTTDDWAKNIEDEEESSSTDASGNKISYRMDWLMAIIIGIAVIVMLFTICVEVVIRNIKIIFLQVISPIAFASYMNPQDKILSNWVKQYIGTYLDLFLKLFAILTVPKIMATLLDSVPNGLSKIFVIAGCLLFIKSAPNFISKILGIEDMAGTFKDSFGLVKAGLGFAAGTAVKTVGGGIVGGAQSALGGGGWKGLASGALGGIGRGFGAGITRKGFGAAMGQQFKANKKNNAARAAGATMLGMLGSRYATSMGRTDAFEKMDAGVKAQQEFSKKNDALKAKAQSEVAKDWNTNTTYSGMVGNRNVTLSGNVNAIKQKMAQAQSSGKGAIKIGGNFVSLADASAVIGGMEKQAINDMINGRGNADVEALRQDVVQSVALDGTGALNGYGISNSSSASDINDAAGRANRDAIGTSGSQEYKTAKANHDSVANGK